MAQLTDQDLDSLLDEALTVTVNDEHKESDANKYFCEDLGILISTGLQVCKNFGIRNFFTQEIPKNAGQDVELWRGASKNDVTVVESGPDTRRFNATIYGLAQNSDQNYLAIFLGCYETELLAVSARKFASDLFVTAASENGYLIARQRLLEFHQPSTARTMEQLREGLNPCSLCDKLHCTLKCSACYAAHYCDIKCQKEHWRSHKTFCKGKRKERKERIKAQKAETLSEANELEQLNQTQRPLTSGARDPTLQKHARENIAAMLNTNFPFLFRVKALSFLGASPEQWDAGEAVGSLPAMVSLLRSETIPGGSDSWDFSWLEFMPAYHILTVGIGGLVTNGVLVNYNKHNLNKFLIETEGAWDSLLHGTHVMLRRAAIRPGPNGPSGVILKAYHDKVITVFRVLSSTVMDHKIGRALGLQHFRTTIVRFRDIFAALSALDNHPNYPPQHGFSYDDVEGLAFRVAGGVDTWCMREGLGNDIRKTFRRQIIGRGPVNANEPFASVLGLDWHARWRYEHLGRRLAEIGINKGGVSSDEEEQKHCQGVKDKNPIEWAMARGLEITCAGESLGFGSSALAATWNLG